MDRRCKSIVRMRIAGLAAEYFFKPYVNKQQQIELIKELKENYRYLLCNFARFHWKSDFKRSIKGLIALVKYKMANGKHE